MLSTNHPKLKLICTSTMILQISLYLDHIGESVLYFFLDNTKNELILKK